MAMTVQTVFDIAIRLMDEQNESTGSTATSDTQEYKVRTISLINSMLDRVYRASDTYEMTDDGTRPICTKVEDFDDELDLDEAICYSVLPYGLASLLLSDENPTLSAYFQNLYITSLVEFENTKPSTGFEDIEDPYGGINMGQFSRW